MKKTHWLLLVLILINCAGWLWYGEVYRSPLVDKVNGGIAEPEIVAAFTFTLQDEVSKKLGQPIEGYEPAMFLQVFPGLAETDFEGVQASIGFYTIENGRLVHKLDDAKLIHSAAPAVTKNGMATLLSNVSVRTGIDLNGQGTLTDIMAALGNQ